MSVGDEENFDIRNSILKCSEERKLKGHRTFNITNKEDIWKDSDGW